MKNGMNLFEKISALSIGIPGVFSSTLLPVAHGASLEDSRILAESPRVEDQIGFAPRNALKTLEVLGEIASGPFSESGEIQIPVEQLPEVMIAAAHDGLRVQVSPAQTKDDNFFRLRFRQSKPNFRFLNEDAIRKIQDLSQQLNVHCDMDGKMER